MPVVVEIPSPLRALCGDRAEVAAPGATVRQVIEALGWAHPRLRARLLDEGGAPRRHLALFLNEEHLGSAGGLDAPVRDGDRLALVPAVAGGAAELDDQRIARWARQLLVPGFGAAGQERLMASRVRVVGADAVASTALVYLVQAGVGTVWIDDPDVVAPADEASWLYGAAAVGRPRAEVAAEALAPMSRFVEVQPYPTGGVPTATLVVASSSAQALAAAEVARRARVPHVVVDADGEGGTVTVVPVGAPCYACGRSAASAGRPPTPAAGALAALGALELLQHVADPSLRTGRRIDMTRGVPSVRATTRLPGCECAPREPAAPADGAAP